MLKHFEQEETDYFVSWYNSLKNQNVSEDDCYEKILMELIRLCLNKEECPPTLDIYDPCNRKRPIVGVGKDHVVAVRDDGKVYSSGLNDHQQCNTHMWKNIVSVSAGYEFTIGVRDDGSCIVIGGNNILGNGEIFKWSNIVSVACGYFHVIGLKSVKWSGCTRNRLPLYCLP